MNRNPGPAVLNLQQQQQQQQPILSTSVTHSRSQSVTSVEHSPSSSSITPSLASSPFHNADPEPAYIAPTAAARLVTSDHEVFFRGLYEDGTISTETLTIFVTNGSLQLVNQFLDFLLYSFLSNAKSTSLAALRPAVTEVLRVRLAKEALTGADQELESYLGGDDETELAILEDRSEPSGDWNLEATWKRCRMQCMVYSSLGDLEEEDEAYDLDNGLEGIAAGYEQYQRQSIRPGVISPAVAIWLTSILEFIGEQTLLVAGHSTIARYSAQQIAVSGAASETNANVTFPQRPMVEELDTEKVALNPSLGRMWRQWRKKIRGARGSFSISTTESILNRLDMASLSRRSSAIYGSRRSSVDDSSRGESIIQDHHPETNLGCVDATATADGEGGCLPPIEESAAVDKSCLTDEVEEEDVSLVQRRPQSWTLPQTRYSPFVLSTVPKRPRSLPDLTRGDFADPDTEIDKFEFDFTFEQRQPYMNIPLPPPLDDEEHELLALSRPNSSGNECQLEAKADDPISELNAMVAANNEDDNKHDVGCQSDVLSMVPISSHAFKSNVKLYEIPSHTAQDIEVTSLPSIDEDDYDPYANNPSPIHRKVTGEHENSFLTYREVDAWRNILNEGGTAVDHASSGSGHSLPDRKIGQLHLIQTSGMSVEHKPSLRMFTPPGSPDRSGLSPSFCKGQRPIHTSGSSSSQTSVKLKSLLPWPNDSGKHSRVLESDSESRSSLHSERLATMDDKERSFEELISSGGTIHCTITPDPIRNIQEGSDQSSLKTGTADLADFFRRTGPDVSTASKGNKQPFQKFPSPIGTERMNDNQPSLSGLLKGSTSFAHSGGSDNKSQQSVTKTVQFNTLAAVGVESLPAVLRQTRSTSPNLNNPGKNRLLAREASGSTGSDTTSALADFFRNTIPPVNGGETPIPHRISRSVAPFRNTMDSTEFDGSEDVSEAAESVLINPSSIITQDSYQSSFSSGSALLRSDSNVKRAPRDYGSTTNTANTSPVIKRKQIRVRDPYDLDFDDDYDDDVEVAAPRKAEEESLADFLRNVAPPPSNTVPKPLVSLNSKNVQKKTSSVSLISRFGRSSRKTPAITNGDKIVGVGIQRPVQGKYVPLQVPSHINSTNSAKIGRNSTTSDNYKRPSYSQARVDFDSQYEPSFSRKISSQRGNYQPRGGRLERNETDSLTEFLKHTGPSPAENLMPSMMPLKDEPRSLLQKIAFSRGKKLIA